MGPTNTSSISILYDSQIMLAKAYNDVYNRKFRHMSLKHKYIRKLIENGIVYQNYLKSNENLANLFTKSPNRDLIISTLSRIWLKY